MAAIVTYPTWASFRDMTANEEFMLRNSALRALDYFGHRWVRWLGQALTLDIEKELWPGPPTINHSAASGSKNVQDVKR